MILRVKLRVTYSKFRNINIIRVTQKEIKTGFMDFNRV